MMKKGPALEQSLCTHKPFAVKVFTTVKKYDYREPWKAPTRHNYTGSGFVIHDDRIITNAHLVAGAIYVEVQVANDTEKYKAIISQVNHDCDLAMLSVNDLKFWEKVSAVSIGEMPLNREKIEVHGFPTGGERYCITTGTVSRSENSFYTHSQQKLLTTQVSAPINPGNSGGAVISKKDGKVLGVVHQELREAQNTAYIIPSNILKHFIYQIDNHVSGFPNLKITTQTMENAWLRSYFGMTKEQSGIRVSDVPRISSASEYLKENDILLEINGIKINNNGTIYLDNVGNVDWTVLISLCHIGDVIIFTLLREGKIYREKIELNTDIRDLNLIEPFEFDKPPTYLFVGGVICLQPITKNLLRDAQKVYPDDTKKIFQQQLLIINTILKSDYSLGYEGFDWEIVKSINGYMVHDMDDAVDAIDQCDKDVHEIETTTNKIIVVPNLRPGEILDILAGYGILNDRSEDLVRVQVDPDTLGDGRRELLFSSDFTETPRPGTPIPKQKGAINWGWKEANESSSSLNLSSSLDASELPSIESIEEVESPLQENTRSLSPRLS